MTKRIKTETVLAVWATKRTPCEQLGIHDYGCTSNADSMWLSLRQVSPDDSTHWLDERAQAMRDIGIYLWFGAPFSDGRQSFAIEVNAHDVYSLDVRKCALLLKTLKWFESRMPTRRDDFKLALQELFANIGLKRAMQYQGINVPETFVPIYEVLPIIFAEYDRRMDRITRLKQSA